MFRISMIPVQILITLDDHFIYHSGFFIIYYYTICSMDRFLSSHFQIILYGITWNRTQSIYYNVYWENILQLILHDYNKLLSELIRQKQEWRSKFYLCSCLDNKKSSGDMHPGWININSLWQLSRAFIRFTCLIISPVLRIKKMKKFEKNQIWEEI